VAARAEPAASRTDWRRQGLSAWLATTDHKRLGILYLWTALGFFTLGGILALLLRLQLARPNEALLERDSYNQVLTVHGTTMIFLVVLPFLTGLGTYLVPLMIGSRRIAFPRLAALGFWLTVFGGAILYGSFLAKGGPASTGWTAYAPLSTLHSPGNGQDFWILGLHVLVVGMLASSINLIATIHAYRARGMNWMRMPLFVWSVLAYAWILALVLPAFAASLSMLELDREGVTHFFDPSDGGSAVLYQHLFWLGTHPAIYVAILPALGIVSEVIPVFSRKPIFGHRAVVWATLAIAAFTLLAWGEHMFVVGLGEWFDSVFMLTALVIAVPLAAALCNWLATLWQGSISFETPMLWALGFVAVITIGLLSGLFLAAFPVAWAVSDSYFVVAHLHYTLFGGSLFAVFAGLAYWWPKLFGRTLDERLGKAQFWLVFVGFNVTFFPQHLLGLLGMPRRVYTYSSGGLWEAYNMVSTIGSFLIALGMLVFAWNVIKTARTGRRAAHDPWQADTLEWHAISPPPEWNFERIPPITSTRPLRDLRRRVQEERLV
jgi:cytochrome c oxidase subunit 1